MVSNFKIPLIGYGSIIEDEKLKEIIDKIMNEEGINISDFRIKDHPELSLRGNERNLIVNVKNFKSKIDGNDTILSFELPKGSYATILIEQLDSQ